MTSFFLITVFILGLIIGSFLNCLIWRLHKKETILGRSYCPECRRQIFWYDNIPLLSYLLLHGKCRHCQKRISYQYPLVEFVVGALFVLAFFYNFPVQSSFFLDGQFSMIALLTLIRDWLLICVMVIIFVYDLRWYLILDVVSLPASLVFLIFNLVIDYLKFNGSLPANVWQGLLFSGIIGMSFFLLQFIISKGRWIGGGDIRLGLLMGLALGWPNILVALFIAYILGSVVGVGLIMAGKKQWGSQVPFGVFLSVATIISLFWGSQLLNWYLATLNF
jgi:prepilin signal peptidase PulO-like enzyme (type II secretory pathway)